MSLSCLWQREGKEWMNETCYLWLLHFSFHFFANENISPFWLLPLLLQFFSYYYHHYNLHLCVYPSSESHKCFPRLSSLTIWMNEIPSFLLDSLFCKDTSDTSRDWESEGGRQYEVVPGCETNSHPCVYKIQGIKEKGKGVAQRWSSRWERWRGWWGWWVWGGEKREQNSIIWWVSRWKESSRGKTEK